MAAGSRMRYQLVVIFTTMNRNSAVKTTRTPVANDTIFLTKKANRTWQGGEYMTRLYALFVAAMLVDVAVAYLAIGIALAEFKGKYIPFIKLVGRIWK